MRAIYLDYNATTPIAPTVQEAMAPFLSEHYGNPSSLHALGRACHEAVEDARSHVAALLRSDPREIIFTSGGTESNNLALKGALLRDPSSVGGHLVISSLEHPATVRPAQFLERLGYSVSVVGCDPQGTIDPQEVKDALRDDTVLVSIIHANNEIGTIQPIRDIARICHDREILVHTDAAQSTGKIPIIADELEIDLLSIAGHKIYAPKGIGALFVRRGTALEPLIHGADHEQGVRAGTENVPYIVGLGQAALLAAKASDELHDRLVALRDELASRLEAVLGDRLTINGKGADRLPNTLSVNLPDVSAHALLNRIPDLCASTGAACHSGSDAVSPTLAAIGLTPETTRGTVRLSVGWYTSQEDIQRAAELLLDAWESLSNSAI